MTLPLKRPPLYTPFDKGLYQVGPLLRPFGSQFGNSTEIENQIFQIDEEFPNYRASKLEALKERKSKYLCESRFQDSAKSRIVLFIIDKLCQEHPAIFTVQKFTVRKDASLGQLRLHCQHSGSTLVFSLEGLLLESQNSSDPYRPTDALEALSLEVQEDFSVWTYEGEEDWMAYVSLCAPNHWAAEEKIGRDFFEVHTPVAGAGPMLKTSKKLVESMVHRGPFVRFAWGIATDRRLNHHPQAPEGWEASQWKGRAFDPQDPKLWVRTERQTLHGFPEEKLSLFTIRTYFQDLNEIKPDSELKSTLQAALRSMTPESLVYKGLSESLDSIVNWLDAK